MGENAGKSVRIPLKAIALLEAESKRTEVPMGRIAGKLILRALGGEIKSDLSHQKHLSKGSPDEEVDPIIEAIQSAQEELKFALDELSAIADRQTSEQGGEVPRIGRKPSHEVGAPTKRARH